MIAFLTSCRCWAAGLSLLSLLGGALATMDEQTLPGPASPALQPAWLANLSAWRAEVRATLNFSGSAYEMPALSWAPSMIVAPQAHTFDRLLFDSQAGEYTPDLFLNDLESRYGRVDGIALWHSYPNLGVDERSQFDLFDDLPGGVPALAALVAEFHKRGIKVGIPYNPWASDPAAQNSSDFVSLASLGAALSVDFLNGDTMGFMPEELFRATVAAGRPLALQPEGGPSLAGLEWTVMAWGEGWVHAPTWKGPFIPDVDLFKWVERRHATQIVKRWATNRVDDLQMAFFNGLSYVAWENVWGIFNEISSRDGEALRRIAAILRFLRPFLTSEGWEPHAAVSSDAATSGVFASRWPVPAGVAFVDNATAWTFVNRALVNFSGPLLEVPCDPATTYLDIYAGVQVDPMPIGIGSSCTLSLAVEGAGFGALLAVASTNVEGNVSLATFLSSMSAMTVMPLAAYNSSVVPLQQVMTDFGTTTLAAAAPPGMLLVPGNASWLFQVNSTIIETDTNFACDVQFPFEQLATVSHMQVLNLPSLYMDATPVTNAQYSRFLAESAYYPAQAQNFLRDWRNGTFPTGTDNKPVTWVDLLDANTFCIFYGKRLPNDYEWQRAAQGDDGRQYPWGDAFDSTSVPPIQQGRTRGPFADVGQYSKGASPFGLLDMVGLVWQWTNEFTDLHTRAALVRGGTHAYTAEGSAWFFPNNLTAPNSVRVNTHNKLLLMSPSYDRHGTVGFRCVQDAVS